jgi:hypothetical protein
MGTILIWGQINPKKIKIQTTFSSKVQWLDKGLITGSWVLTLLYPGCESATLAITLKRKRIKLAKIR